MLGINGRTEVVAELAVLCKIMPVSGRKSAVYETRQYILFVELA